MITRQQLESQLKMPDLFSSLKKIEQAVKSNYHLSGSIFSVIQSQPDMFKRLVTENIDINNKRTGYEKICDLFPGYIEEIESLAIKDDNIFNLVMGEHSIYDHSGRGNRGNWENLNFHGYRNEDEALNKILSNLQHFRRAFRGFDDLCTFLNTPLGRGYNISYGYHSAEKAIGLILSNNDEFLRIINKFEDILSLCDCDAMLSSDQKKICLHVISNIELIKKLGISACDLVKLANKFPCQENKIIKSILADVDFFKEIVKTRNDLAILAAKFPQYKNIFKQNSVDEAIKALNQEKSLANIRRSARIIGQGARNESNVFSTLPTEIQVDIAARMRNPKSHTEEKASKIALSFLNKPQKPLTAATTPAKPIQPSKPKRK